MFSNTTIWNVKNLFHDVPLHWTTIRVTDVTYKSKISKYLFWWYNDK